MPVDILNDKAFADAERQLLAGSAEDDQPAGGSSEGPRQRKRTTGRRPSGRRSGGSNPDAPSGGSSDTSGNPSGQTGNPDNSKEAVMAGVTDKIAELKRRGQKNSIDKPEWRKAYLQLLEEEKDNMAKVVVPEEIADDDPKIIESIRRVACAFAGKNYDEVFKDAPATAGVGQTPPSTPPAPQSTGTVPPPPTMPPAPPAVVGASGVKYEKHDAHYWASYRPDGTFAGYVANDVQKIDVAAAEQKSAKGSGAKKLANMFSSKPAGS